MTFLFDNVIIGPIHSRRMGISLGVNLLPLNSKLCNFDCIYCECGWNEKVQGIKPRFNSKQVVLENLEDMLSKLAKDGKGLDVITFAGNGEPTTHPDFAEIIDRTLELRDKYFPNVKVSVLTNATLINRDKVRHALEKVDIAMLKIDAVTPEMINLINEPNASYSLQDVLDGIKKFNGEVIIQTMFLRGEKNGMSVDNTVENELQKWLEVIKEIAPDKVVIYTIDRDTPLKTLSKVPVEDLERIGQMVEDLGIKCEVTK